MSGNVLINEEVVRRLAEDYDNVSEEDMLIYIAETLIYASDQPVPIRGLGDDVIAVAKYAKGRIVNIVTILCESYKDDLELAKALAEEDNIKKMIVIGNVVVKILESQGVAGADMMNEELMPAIAFVISKAGCKIDDICEKYRTEL